MDGVVPINLAEEETPISFRYKEQLEDDEIRLLKVESGQESQIKCSLHRQSLGTAEPYIAVSYVWGHGSQTEEVLCDGEACQISPNLRLALSHIREKYCDRLLWADAICINQDDKDEKTRQVRLMHDIFEQADLVIIWLGEEDPGDRCAYDLAVKLRDAIGDSIHDPEGINAATKVADYSGFTDPALQPLLDMDEEWMALQKLLTRPWFSRAWIIQELIAAKRALMLSGNFEMDPHVLLNLGCLFTTHLVMAARFNRIPGAVAQLQKIVTIASLRYLVTSRLRGKDLHLGEVLPTASFSLASDPRDRVFALIGLTGDISQDIIDYNADRVTIVSSLAREWLSIISNPALVLGFTHLRHQTEGTPSWVPDWTSPFKPSATGSVAMTVEVDPSLDYGTAAGFSYPSGVLRIHGKMLDTIEEVITRLPLALDFTYISKLPSGITPETTSKLNPDILEWLQEVLEFHHRNEKYVTGISTEEAIWRSLIFDGAPWDKTAPPEYKDAFRAWIRLLKDGAKTKALVKSYEDSGRIAPPELLAEFKTLEECRKTASPIIKTVDKSVRGRYFCRTRDGYIGLIPEEGRVGDAVISLCGAHVPFVLRKRPENNAIGENAVKREVDESVDEQRWGFIGDCYMHGLMHDVPAKMEDVPVQDFFID